MNKILNLLAAAILLTSVGCAKQDNEGPDTQSPSIALEITGIQDNQATISAGMAVGESNKAKIVENVKKLELDLDLNNEIKLVNYVEKNGIEISLPYEKTITRLASDTEFVTLVIAYNNEGRAFCSAHKTWTSVGRALSWSEDNSAGELEDNQWN